jgi:hypothetical protein
MLRTTLTRSTISRSIVVARQLHSSPPAGKTVTEKVTEVADKVRIDTLQALAVVLLTALSAGQQVCWKRSRQRNRYWREGGGFH